MTVGDPNGQWSFDRTLGDICSHGTMGDSSKMKKTENLLWLNFICATCSSISQMADACSPFEQHERVENWNEYSKRPPLLSPACAV